MTSNIQEQQHAQVIEQKIADNQQQQPALAKLFKFDQKLIEQNKFQIDVGTNFTIHVATMMIGFLCGHLNILSSLFVSLNQYTRRQTQYIEFEQFYRHRGYYMDSQAVNEYYNYLNEIIWSEKSYRWSFYVIIGSLILTSLSACLMRSKEIIRKYQKSLYYLSCGQIFCLFNAIANYNYHSDLFKQMLPILGIIILLLIAQLVNLHYNYVKINMKDSLLLVLGACLILNGILSVFYYSIPRPVIFSQIGLSYLIYHLTKLSTQIDKSKELEQPKTPEKEEEIPECQLKLVKTQYLVLKKSHSCVLGAALLLLLLLPLLGMWTLIVTGLFAINFLIDTSVIGPKEDHYLAVLILYADLISPLKSLQKIFQQ